MEPILLYNRKTGSLEEEAVFEKDVMEFLYGSRLGFFITELLFKHRWATELYARLQRGPGSRSKIRKFVESQIVHRRATRRRRRGRRRLRGQLCCQLYWWIVSDLPPGASRLPPLQLC